VSYFSTILKNSQKFLLTGDFIGLLLRKKVGNVFVGIFGGAVSLTK